jgi:hypothetical protein
LAPQLRGFCHIEPQRRRALVPAFKGYGSGTGNIAFSADGTTFARGHHLSTVKCLIYGIFTFVPNFDSRRETAQLLPVP